MSLSQKHFGKILVPWFNIAEWKHVYNLIYSEAQDWPKVLQILKIWKQRTPLLSAGVEGTLIVLEALLVNIKELSSFEITHIYSTSLVRFLNLCATNSDKQGTFYKTAMKNELPRWLVSIRHDIAHNHKLPSQSMLELSLKFCLDWLKEKYWNVQIGQMMDFVIEKSVNTIVEDAIFVYSKLNYQGGQSVEVMKYIDKFENDRQSQFSIKTFVIGVDKILYDEIKQNKEESANKICNLLIDNHEILAINCEVNNTGAKVIPTDILNRWNSFINVIYAAEILPIFIKYLFNFICNGDKNSAQREVASLWIKEIFIALIGKDKNLRYKNKLYLKTSNNSLKNKNFPNTVLNNLTEYNLIFLEEVLQYSEAPVEFIKQAVALVSAFNPKKRINNGIIYSTDDLKSSDLSENLPLHLITNEKSRGEKSRWTLLQDTTPYLNLPLGILPHQDPSCNPLLVT